MSEAERSILGAILLEPAVYDEVSASGLVPEDFSLDSHRSIYRAMCCLSEDSAIDCVTLTEYLEKHRELARVGDVGYVASLVDGVPDRPSVKQYIRIVKEQSAKRRLVQSCNAAITGLSDGLSSREGIETLTDGILRVQSGSDEFPAKRVLEFTDQTWNDWVDLSNGNDDLIGLSTGVASVDLATTGIRNSEYWIIAGRTGDGKTNLALQAVAANCISGVPVGMFSIEMPKGPVIERLWASEARVDYRHIRFPRRLTDQIKQNLKEAMLEVGRWPLFIVEESGIPISKLVAKAKLMVRRENVKLIVVDYVQLISARGANERERVSGVSKALAGLAKDTGVPILAISQFTRPKDGNENYRPTIFNLKESGSLENDANVVILIYRPVDERKMKTNADELIIGKQRGGLTSIEPVCLMPWLRFCERDTR